MKEVTRWWSEIEGGEGTWLILGKGPTFDRLKDQDVSEMRTIALNHAITHVPADVASVIDLDVVADCAQAIDRNAKALLMPRYPHVDYKASDRPLEDFFGELPVLEKLDREGRLIWYHLGSGRPVAGSPRIPLGKFSAEVIVHLLATLGVRRIRTLGVDGGTAYSGSFDEEKKLANRQSSFDIQWQGITRVVRQHGIDYAPLTSEVPIRVFIGTDESQRLAARVLEFSILEHTPVPVVFDTLEDVEAPTPKHARNQPRTGFSFNRFDIPRRAGFRGHAVYLDADMLVFRNFLELWDIPCNGARILHARSPNPAWPSQFSVLKLSCADLEWDVAAIVRGLDEGAYDYEALMQRLCIEPADFVRPGIPPEWNSLEHYEPGRTGLLHYTNMSEQPWVRGSNPLGGLWVRALRRALDAGFISVAELDEAVSRGHVRPSLRTQVRLPEWAWGSFLRLVAPVLDLGYKPHRAFKLRSKQLEAAARAEVGA